MDAPQGQVVVRTCQGTIHCLLIDGGKELAALEESLVLIHEKGLAMLRRVLDAASLVLSSPLVMNDFRTL